MPKKPSPHLAAALQALFVAFLWSTSWVLIKIGLKDIPALTFAGLRYALAFVCLLPFAMQPAPRAAIRRLGVSAWTRLAALGILFYTLTQGAQFVALNHLAAATVNLILSFTTVLVALLGIALLAERPTVLQWAGAALYLIGAAAYFYPAALAAGQGLGVAATLVALAANAGASVLGRRVNRAGDISPLVVTTASMGIGSVVLLGAGIATQGLPPLTPTHWAIVAWLAVVNTAFAFTLWNHTLRTLSAMESSIINNTMLIHIPMLAWLFLGEALTGQQIAGLILAGLGTLVVQLRFHRKQ